MRRLRANKTMKNRHHQTTVKFLIAALIGASCGINSSATVANAAAGAQAKASGHPHADILSVVEGAAMAAASEKGLSDIEVRVRPLDQRLRPAYCDQPLEIVRPHAGRALGPVSYGVRCSGTVPWTLYLRADVSAAMRLPVLREAMPRGALVNKSDLTVEERRITSQANDFIVDGTQAVGMQLKRSMPAGSALRYGQVSMPRLVTRGQTVTLLAGVAGLEVRMQGKAMGNGALGDRLQVTNLNSGKRVEGVVLADGSVRIP